MPRWTIKTPPDEQGFTTYLYLHEGDEIAADHDPSDELPDDVDALEDILDDWKAKVTEGFYADPTGLLFSAVVGKVAE